MAPLAPRSTLPWDLPLQSVATGPRPLQRLPQTHSWVTCACSLQGHRPETRQARAPQARTEGHPALLGREDVQEMLKHACGDLANFYIILFKENKLFLLQKGYTFIHVIQGRRIAQSPVSTGAGCMPARAPCSPHQTSLLTEKTHGRGIPDSVRAALRDSWTPELQFTCKQNRSAVATSLSRALCAWWGRCPVPSRENVPRPPLCPGGSAELALTPNPTLSILPPRVSL